MPSLKEIADEANRIEEGLGIDVSDVLNKLTQEIGEFNDAIQKFRGRYCKSPGSKGEIEEELGDVIMNLISLANRVGINPDELKKYAERTLTKFKEREEDYRRNAKEQY